MIFIYCNWVSTRWQWSVDLYKNRKETDIYRRRNNTQNSTQNNTQKSRETQNTQNRNKKTKQENKYTENIKRHMSSN